MAKSKSKPFSEDPTFLLHQGGKIEIQSRVAITTREELSMVYTPGVADVCMAIHNDRPSVYDWTIKRHFVAVVTDGTAVLGLGDIGPEAALPVMEGKAMLFKQFANIDAFPICLNQTDPEQIIQTVKALAPTFGGINLEDISAPRCFEIEKRLQEELDIPVFHDDQHGTAIVAAAALINACKIVGKPLESLKVVLSGTGAAGTACAKMITKLGVKNIIGCDRHGAIHKGRDNLNDSKEWFATHANPTEEKGALHDVIQGADVFLGVSSGNLIKPKHLKTMAKDPIVFAMANPEPEIAPELALPHVAIMATGRSDYPNQINNVLCFPGIFKGALSCMSSCINDEMKMAAAHAIANSVSGSELSPTHIIPSVFNTSVASNVANAVEQAAIATKVAKAI